MEQPKEIKSKSPSYYAKRRLIRNKPAMLGLAIIIIAHLVAILGYLIMPDSTPNANDGSVKVQKKLPGFSVTMLKERNNIKIEKVNFFTKMLFGEESEFRIHPIDNYEILEQDGELIVKAKVLNRDDVEAFPLIDVVKPLYVGGSDKLNTTTKAPYVRNGDEYTYLDLDEKVHTVTKQELIDEFNKHHLERRTHLLGTDKAGRDLLSKLLYGTRISLSIGFISVLISLTVGITLGAVSGFFGGMVDKVIMWFMTAVWSIPGIMLVIAISMALGKGIWAAFVAVGLIMWVDVARVVRGEFMSIKEKLFVEAARSLGIGTITIMFKHILPNILGSIIVVATANFAAAILLEAGLSFLGLGVQAPMPSWGAMLKEGYDAMLSPDSWHLLIFPSICIFTMVIAFNLFGIGLRDAFDPKSAVK